MESSKLENSEIKNLFIKKGFKTTSQRLVIYKSLIQNKFHPSAETIFDSISREHPSISLGTVYKTLDLFVENGLAHKVPSKSGFSRYDGNIGNHSHIYISNTNEIIDFMDEGLESIIKKYLDSKSINNLDIKNISIQINGDKIELEKEISINN